MPFGFVPTSATAISDYPSPKLGITIAAVNGVMATGFVGTVSGAAQILHVAIGMEAVAELGTLEGLSVDGAPTVFVRGFSLTTALGTSLSAARSGFFVSVPITATGEIGNAIAQGTFLDVESVQATGQIGSVVVTEKLPWTKIVPNSTPGWLDITPYAPIE